MALLRAAVAKLMGSSHMEGCLSLRAGLLFWSLAADCRLHMMWHGHSLCGHHQLWTCHARRIGGLRLELGES